MELFGILLGSLLFLFFLATFICFRLVFFISRPKKTKDQEFTPPSGEIYEPYYDLMRAWNKETKTLPYQDLLLPARCCHMPQSKRSS